MTAVSPQIEEILYEGLISLDDPRDRAGFLDQTCQGDPELRARLEELVAIHDEAEKFFTIDTPPEPGITQTGGPARPAIPEDVGTRIGRYRLLERLGEGGCGVVYLAEQLEPVRRRVALKIVRLGFDTASVIARFEMERQALALMDHPNIARVLDAGATASGRPYFVMQMVEGLRITDFCDRNRLDLRQRLKLFIPVCLAIQHAHQKGIIHCDIKPSNVMVSLHDAAAVPKVIDFGIARATEGVAPDDPQAGAPPFIGTPAYMSPEQVESHGRDVDTRSDIYSLGVLLYELLAGTPPRDATEFENRSPEEIRRLLAETTVADPSARFPALPAEARRCAAAARATTPRALARQLRGDLDAIVRKAMEPDRQRRYGTASELAADISRHLGHEPVNARHAGGLQLLAKLIRRNKVAFAAGAVVTLALAGGFGTSTWLFLREHRALEEQARLRQAAETARYNEVKLREAAEAAETVAHAAVLISHGKTEEADELLAPLELDQVPASLEAATVFREAGDWLLHQGRWDEAANRFAAVAQAVSQADKSHSESISIHFVAAAAAVAAAGNIEQYEHLRTTAAERFATSKDPVIADEIVKSCLLKPVTPELLSKLDPLLNVIEGNMPWDREDQPHEVMEAWQTLSMALAKFRRGDFQGAKDWANRSLSHPNENPSRKAASRAILAMVFNNEGRLNDARPLLESARAPIRDYYSQPFHLGTSAEGFWFDWLIARILLREAERVTRR